MRELQILILLPAIAILSALAFQQFISSFGLPPEADQILHEYKRLNAM